MPAQHKFPSGVYSGSRYIIATMNCGVKTLLCLLGCLAVATEGKAILSEVPDTNPYHAIVERNVFDLRAPPPPPTNTAPVVPPSNVKLTGIASLFGPKRAMFMVVPGAMPGKPPGKEESVILSEGQRQGSLEVQEINEKSRTVRISNEGVVSVITFEVTKPQNMPAGAGAGFAGGNPQLHPINFVQPPPALPSPNGGYANNNGNAGNQANNNLDTTASTTMPTRTLRTEPLSREEQTILMEIERERTKPQVENGEMPPLPPTEITEAAGGGSSGPALPGMPK
jgi:hypothetical protein